MVTKNQMKEFKTLESLNHYLGNTEDEIVFIVPVVVNESITYCVMYKPK